MKNHFSEPSNHRNLNISKHIYLKKNTAHRFEDHICTDKLEKLFLKNFFFQGLGAFFTAVKRLIRASFLPQKINFKLFFKCDYLILIQYKNIL